MRLPVNPRPVTRLLLPCLIMAAPATTSAQQAQGQFVSAAFANARTNANGGLFLVAALAGTVTNLNAGGDLVNSHSIATDPYDDTAVWVGTRSRTANAAPSIWRVVTAGGQILSATTLNAGLTSADMTVHQVRVFGHELLFLTDTRLGAVPLTGGKTRELLKFDATTGTPGDFATDGRQVFVAMQPTSTTLAEHIVRVDLENLPVRTTIYQLPGITYFMPSLTLDDAGNLLLTEFEAFSGAATLRQIDPAGRSLRAFTLPFTYGVGGARMDPAGGVIVVAGRRYDTATQSVVSGFITILNWAIFKTEFGTSLEPYHRIDIRRHESIHRYGHVCEANSKWRAEIAASGLPRIGNANYQLKVSGGYAGRSAMILIGVHGAMPVPFPLAVMGAGTCVLGVQPLVSLGVQLTANGDFTLPAPIPAGLGPMNLDVQWLVGDGAANAAGFVSSQVGSVVIR